MPNVEAELDAALLAGWTGTLEEVRSGDTEALEPTGETGETTPVTGELSTVTELCGGSGSLLTSLQYVVVIVVA
jgi:hypothetical protein